ncbi:hypothetical protein D3C80_1160800 [compost metagenome]
MGDFSAGRRRDQRGDPGITEEVQHLQRPVSRLDGMFQPFPMHDLFREDADMPESREAAQKFDAEQRQGPGLTQRRLGKTPAAHAVLIRVAGKDSVGILPHAIGNRRFPQRLRLGTDDAVVAVLFELQTIPAVDQVKIARAARFQNDRNLFCGQFACALLEGPHGHLLNRRRYADPFFRRRLRHAAHGIRLALFRR